MDLYNQLKPTIVPTNTVSRNTFLKRKIPDIAVDQYLLQLCNWDFSLAAHFTFPNQVPLVMVFPIETKKHFNLF